jgi:5'-3' exoribonuclease 1
MGIPHYFRVITQTYSNIVGITMPKTDHIFFDFNGAIHQSAKKIIDQAKAKGTSIVDIYGESMDNEQTEEIQPIEREIMEAVEDYVRGLTNLVRPAKGVYIYMDGVAPHAKLMQQRKRRYLSMLRYKLLQTEPIWDTNAISPGTMFMIRLAAFLRKQFRDIPLRAGILTRYSFSDENGEAEHKIFATMANIPHDESVMIHGLDADLIMLSLLSHRPNITLMREPHEGADFQFLDIDRLREGILKELSTRYLWPIGLDKDKDGSKGKSMDLFGREACDAIESYIVWCFLLGNDFLPHMPTLHLQKNGLQKILEASQHMMLVNSANSMINWDTIYMVLEELSREEDYIMHTLIDENVKKRCHAKTEEEKVDMYPLLDENKSDLAKEIYIKGGLRIMIPWQALYYKKLFGTRMHDMSVVADACKEYMTGMEWTYRYYKRLARNSEWYYPFPYAPAMIDLANHIAAGKNSHLQMIEEWKENHKIPTFIPDYVQLLCILPPESKHLLPNRLRDIITDPKLGCTHMYPIKYPVLTFLKMRLWECCPILPPLDIPLLKKSSGKIVTQIEKLKPRAKITEAFSKGFHIAK